MAFCQICDAQKQAQVFLSLASRHFDCRMRSVAVLQLRRSQPDASVTRNQKEGDDDGCCRPKLQSWVALAELMSSGVA